MFIHKHLFENRTVMLRLVIRLEHKCAYMLQSSSKICSQNNVYYQKYTFLASLSICYYKKKYIKKLTKVIYLNKHKYWGLNILTTYPQNLFSSLIFLKIFSLSFSVSCFESAHSISFNVCSWFLGQKRPMKKNLKKMSKLQISIIKI